MHALSKLWASANSASKDDADFADVFDEDDHFHSGLPFGLSLISSAALGISVVATISGIIYYSLRSGKVRDNLAIQR